MNVTRLSADQYESIVAGLRSDGGDSQHEKRSMPRVGLRTKLDIISALLGDKGATKITVWLRDISAHGLGMLTSHSLALGSGFVALFGRDRGEILKVEYIVVHCSTLSPGLYSVGAKLKSAMPPDAPALPDIP